VLAGASGVGLRVGVWGAGAGFPVASRGKQRRALTGWGGQAVQGSGWPAAVIAARLWLAGVGKRCRAHAGRPAWEVS